MPLRNRLSSVAETVQEFDIAAAERFYEGQALLVSNSGAAIYLMGYSSEMLLKNAYFRLTGASPADLVGPRLAPAKTQASHLISAIPHESFHSIRFWAMLIQARRNTLGFSWPAQFEMDFEFHTERLYNNWWVEMRYRRDISLAAEATDTLDDVTWLRFHDVAFWTP